MGLLETFTSLPSKSLFDQIESHILPYPAAVSPDVTRNSVRKPMVNHSKWSTKFTNKDLITEKENEMQIHINSDQIMTNYLFPHHGGRKVTSNHLEEMEFPQKQDMFDPITPAFNVLCSTQLGCQDLMKYHSKKGTTHQNSLWNLPIEQTEKKITEEQESFQRKEKKRRRSSDGSQFISTKKQKASAHESQHKSKCPLKKYEILLNIYKRQGKINCTLESSHRWTRLGEPFEKYVFLNNKDPPVQRMCYPAIRHAKTGLIVRERDCVLLRVDGNVEALPSVAKVAHLWKDPESGEIMMSFLWYYRPQDIEQGGQDNYSPHEVFASQHADHSSVDCIEDKCYVLSFSEYCRYQRKARAYEEGIVENASKVPELPHSNKKQKIPLNAHPELVLFCARIFNFRLKRLMKPPEKVSFTRNQR